MKEPEEPKKPTKFDLQGLPFDVQEKIKKIAEVKSEKEITDDLKNDIFQSFRFTDAESDLADYLQTHVALIKLINFKNATKDEEQSAFTLKNMERDRKKGIAKLNKIEKRIGDKYKVYLDANNLRTKNFRKAVEFQLNWYKKMAKKVNNLREDGQKMKETEYNKNYKKAFNTLFKLK